MRVVEAEFAFRMGRDVAPGASEEEVMDAVSALHLAVEVPSSRFAEFQVAGGPSLLADSACAGNFVLGPEVPDWQGDELRRCATKITINGEIAAEGCGKTVLDDPRRALRWIADELTRFGSRLEAGQIVTTGTTTVPPAVGAGDTVQARFGTYGEMQFTFSR